MQAANRQVQHGLREEVDALRQLLLLARGPMDPIVIKLDEAIQSDNDSRIWEARTAFYNLPEDERNCALGITRGDPY